MRPVRGGTGSILRTITGHFGGHIDRAGPASPWRLGSGAPTWTAIRPCIRSDASRDVSTEEPATYTHHGNRGGDGPLPWWNRWIHGPGTC